MTASRVVVAVAGWLALAAAAPAVGAAATFTFGANLAAVAPDPSASVCSAPVPAYGVPAGSQSCMASYLGTGTDSLVAPASGTVSTIRVKVGPGTGPMRVNVIRFLFRQNPGDPAHPTSAGPFLQAYGPQFTPAANATTPVATNLAMQEDSTPAPNDGTTIQVIDALALEVAAPNVPIPLFASGPGTLTYLTYPSPTQQGLAAPSPNGIPSTLLGTGAGVLMSADLTTRAPPVITPLPPPIPPPTVAPPPVPPPPPIPRVGLPKQSFTVRNGAATIPVKCTVADCRGRLALLNTRGAATTRSVMRKATKKKTTIYGSATFAAKAGRTAPVKVKLNKSGRALLKHRKKVTVYAKVTFTSGGGATRSFKVTLKR